MPGDGMDMNCARVVMIVGGYGAVGSRLSRRLLAEGFRIVVAGHRVDEAMRVAASIGAEARHIDLGDPATWEAACDGIDCVVTCMDQGGTAFVEHLFARAIDYADVTANDSLFRAIERLAPGRSAAMLSVGLAPGLTNLLAAHASARLDRTDAIDIGLLMGLGDHHGDAGLEWVADSLFDPARDRRGAPIEFGFGRGRRTAHCLDFSDQHALRRTLAVEACTRIGFDSRLATSALFALAGGFAGNAAVRAATLAAFRRVRIGSRRCNVSVHAHGLKDGRRAIASAHFAGEVETETTARLAAMQIAEFLRRRPPPGVWHSHQILDLAQMPGAIETRGIGRIVLDPLSAGSYRGADTKEGLQ